MAEKNVLIDVNLNNNEIQNVVLQNLAAEPTGKEGKIFYDSASGVKAPKFHNGTTWKRIATHDELPVVNNATLTIQKNGTNVQTFTANASSNKTANITVPTKTSEITNDSGFITKDVDNLTNYTKSSSLATVATSGKFSDLQNKPTTISGYGITDAYTKTEVDNKVSSIYKYKGNVSTYANLPSTGQVVGDVYNVESNGANYAWDGTQWDKLGETIDLTPYLLKTEAASTYATIANLNLKAPLASPTLTGTPKAPTASAGTNTTQIATTAFVQSAISANSITLTASNPALTATNGLCTWTISNTLNNADVICSVREASSGEEVFTSVTYSAASVVIKINSTESIAAGTYKAVIIGQKISS